MRPLCVCRSRQPRASEVRRDTHALGVSTALTPVRKSRVERYLSERVFRLDEDLEDVSGRTVDSLPAPTRKYCRYSNPLGDLSTRFRRAPDRDSVSVADRRGSVRRGGLGARGLDLRSKFAAARQHRDHDRATRGGVRSLSRWGANSGAEFAVPSGLPVCGAVPAALRQRHRIPDEGRTSAVRNWRSPAVFPGVQSAAPTAFNACSRPARETGTAAGGGAIGQALNCCRCQARLRPLPRGTGASSILCDSGCP